MSDSVSKKSSVKLNKKELLAVQGKVEETVQALEQEKKPKSQNDEVVEPKSQNDEVVEPKSQNDEVVEPKSSKPKTKKEPKVKLTKEERQAQRLEEHKENLKLLESQLKDIKNQIKQTRKQIKRLGPKDPNRKPGGITKAVSISKDLAHVLGVDHCDQQTRPNVMKYLSKIFTERELKGEKRQIHIERDPQLKALFGEPVHLVDKKKPELGYGYSWNNIQTYLKPHFETGTSEDAETPVEPQPKAKPTVKKAKPAVKSSKSKPVSK